MKKSIFHSLSDYIYILIVSLVFFLPFISQEFALHNDYTFHRYYNIENEFFWFPESKHLMVIGRPIQAILINLQFMFVNDFTGVMIGRFVSLGFVLSVALIIFNTAVKFFNSKILAYAISFSFLLLPAIYIHIFWFANLLPGSFTIFLSSVVFVFFQKYRESKKLPYLVLAFLIFLIGLMVYPPNMMFFLFFTLMGLFRPLAEQKEVIIDTIYKIAFVSISIVVYFLLIKILVHFLLLIPEYRELYASLPVHYKINVDLNPIHIVQKWFVLHDFAFPAVFGVNDLLNRNLLFPLLILLAIYFPLVNHKDRVYLKNTILRFGLFWVVIVLSIAPVVVPENTTSGFRLIGSYSTMLLFLTIVLLYLFVSKQKNGIIQYVLIGMVTILLVSNFVNNSLNIGSLVSNAIYEYRYLKLAISRFDGDTLRAIKIRQIPAETSYAGGLSREFTQAGVNYGLMSGILYNILDRTGIDYDKKKLVLFSTDPYGQRYQGPEYHKIIPAARPAYESEEYLNNLFDSEDGVLTINMNYALGLSPGSNNQKRILEISSSNPFIDAHDNASFLIDGNAKDNGFWEDGRLPLEVTFKVQKSFRPKSYSIQAGNFTPERMPVSWTLLASNDREEWKVIDSQKISTDWNVSEVKTFSLESNKTNYNFYQLRFSGENPKILRIYEISFN